MIIKAGGTIADFISKWESQLRKGVLEFVVLLCLREEEYYGYALIREVKTLTSLDISEGTIYPLLNRLKKEGLVVSRWVEQESGVPRKYYRVTEEGKCKLTEMETVWMNLHPSIQKLMAAP